MLYMPVFSDEYIVARADRPLCGEILVMPSGRLRKAVPNSL